ncbi:MAG: ethyl tert-butyl ether degradation protein EthD [Bacteroidetes bacterium]|nr:ethyl tert-butyl ether degradation protein EthD [Bacteroidota bacterium]
MVKLVALYKKPSEIEEFDKHYDAVHLPLVRKYPGLRKLEVTRITGAPIGETKFHVMAEMYFDSREEMDKALVSQEGKAIARDLLSFAAPLVTVFIGEVDG